MRRKRPFPITNDTAWQPRVAVRELKSLLTNGKTVTLILPVVMTQKDFEILRKWFELVADADDYSLDDKGDEREI